MLSILDSSLLIVISFQHTEVVSKVQFGGKGPLTRAVPYQRTSELVRDKLDHEFVNFGFVPFQGYFIVITCK